MARQISEDQTTVAPETINDQILTYIVPAIIIGLMLILAIVLACVLRRKQQSGKLHLFYSEESLPPRDPVILKAELINGEHESFYNTGKVPYEEPLLLPCDQIISQPQESKNKNMNNVPELDKLLKLEEAPISIDPHSLKCKSRPSPIYKKRQLYN